MFFINELNAFHWLIGHGELQIKTSFYCNNTSSLVADNIFFSGFFFTAIISYQYSLCFQKIYIPGDNDIGGEFRDFRTQKKVDRFVKHFENLTGVTTFGFIDYIKVYMCS